MHALTAVFCLLTGLSAAVAGALGRPIVAGVLKMLAASAYIAFAVQLGATETTYGRVVLAALLLSWLGDLLLIGTGRLFLAGLGAFLVAHVAYAAAFLIRGVELVPAAAGAAVMAVVGMSVMRWLLAAQLPVRYRPPVVAYVAAIGVMVALAIGTAWPDLVVLGRTDIGQAIVLGAVAFAASDILVARHRFVDEEAMNRLIGLPLYFAAQLLLASSV
ncbi:MAG: lysoplasmalogenase family protein [Candidatus Longimicrobiales bacterium M2_2A_002]